jgi:hypothetical protein
MRWGLWRISAIASSRLSKCKGRLAAAFISDSGTCFLANGRPGIARRRNSGRRCLRCGRSRAYRSGPRSRFCGRGSGRWLARRTLGRRSGGGSELNLNRIGLKGRFRPAVGCVRLGRLHGNGLWLIAGEREGHREILVRSHCERAGGLTGLSGGSPGFRTRGLRSELHVDGLRLERWKPVGAAARSTTGEGQARGQNHDDSVHVTTVY